VSSPLKWVSNPFSQWVRNRLFPHIPYVSLTSLDSSAVLHFGGVHDGGIGWDKDTSFHFHEKAASRCHTTADHQSSALDVAGPRQPKLSTPHSHASRKDIRSDGDRASPLGSTSNLDSSCPSPIAVVTHDQATMSIPPQLFYRYSLQAMSPAAQYYHAARSFLFSVLRVFQSRRIPCLSIYLFPPTVLVAKVVEVTRTCQTENNRLFIKTLCCTPHPYMLSTRVTTITNVL
jgi:hypothetical protein